MHPGEGVMSGGAGVAVAHRNPPLAPDSVRHFGGGVSQTQPLAPNLYQYYGAAAGHPRHRTVMAVEQVWLQIASTAQQIPGEDGWAQVAIDVLLRHNPLHAGALVRLGHLLHSQQKYAQAVEAYQKALSVLEHGYCTSNAVGVSLPSTWAALAHCCLLLDDLPRAFQAYQQALSYAGGARDPVLWFGVGILYDRYGADEHALEAFAAVLKLEGLMATGPSSEAPTRYGSALTIPSPLLRELYYRVGVLLRNRKSFNASLACFEYNLLFLPSALERADIQVQIAITLLEKGELLVAKAMLEELVRWGRGASASRSKTILGWILACNYEHDAAAALQQDKPAADPGLPLLLQAVEEEPGDALAWYYLGRTYLLRKSYNKSYEAYQEAVYRDGQNTAFWNSIGILYLEIRQYRDALDAFSRAIHQNPAVWQVWWNLGLLYESCNNQLADALDAYKRAAELAPHNRAIIARIKLLQGAIDPYTPVSHPSSSHSPPSSSSSSSSSSSPSPSPSDSSAPNNTAPLSPPSSEVFEVDPMPFMLRPVLLGSPQTFSQNAPGSGGSVTIDTPPASAPTPTPTAPPPAILPNNNNGRPVANTVLRSKPPTGPATMHTSARPRIASSSSSHAMQAPRAAAPSLHPHPHPQPHQNHQHQQRFSSFPPPDS